MALPLAAMLHGLGTAPLHPQSPPGAFCSAVIRVEGTGVNKSAWGCRIGPPMVGARRRGQLSPTPRICPHFILTPCGPKATHPSAAGFLALVPSDPELCLRNQGPYQVPTGSRQRKRLKYVFFFFFQDEVPIFQPPRRERPLRAQQTALPAEQDRTLPPPSPARLCAGAGSSAAALKTPSRICIGLHAQPRPHPAPPLPASTGQHPRQLRGRDCSKLSSRHAGLCCSFSIQNKAGPQEIPGSAGPAAPIPVAPIPAVPSQRLPPHRCPSQRRGKPPAAFAGGVSAQEPVNYTVPGVLLLAEGRLRLHSPGWTVAVLFDS